MSDPRDVALGLAVIGAGLGLTATRAALAPVRLAARAPLVGGRVRRMTDDLAIRGARTRVRLDAGGEALTDAAARMLAERRVVERVAAEVLAVTDVDAVVTVVLEHERTQQALERALLSPGLERMLVQVLESHLVDELTDEVARMLAERHVVERVAAEVLAVTDVDAVVTTVLEHERTQQALERALLSPGLERMLVQVLESHLVDELTERVLASPELERVVGYVATSPQVLDVVTQQTKSLAGEVASGMRARAQSVDDVAENTVRGWLRRPRPHPS